VVEPLYPLIDIEQWKREEEHFVDKKEWSMEICYFVEENNNNH
jgi:hypothetical protein